MNSVAKSVNCGRYSATGNPGFQLFDGRELARLHLPDALGRGAFPYWRVVPEFDEIELNFAALLFAHLGDGLFYFEDTHGHNVQRDIQRVKWANSAAMERAGGGTSLPPR